MSGEEQVVEAGVEAGIEVSPLQKFCTNNSQAIVTQDAEHWLIEKPWGNDDARFKFPLEGTGLIDDFNQILINPQFDAIFHLDTHQAEFIFTYLNLNNEVTKDYINRKFKIYFNDQEFDCRIDEPTERLFRVATAYEQLPSEAMNNSAPQLRAFKDGQRQDHLSDRAKSFFKDKVPRSFFVSCTDIYSVDWPNLAKHLNFLSSYYDRYSPTITIKDIEKQETDGLKSPYRMIEGEFPKSLVVHQADEIILQLLLAGRRSDPRFAFLYFYQIFEYAGYYYIDEKAKKALRNYLKDPALINCGEDKVSELFAIFTDLNHNDDVKMRKVIEECCDPLVIWKEVENDKSFFSAEQIFEGGFSCPPLVSMDTTSSSWQTMWMPKTFDLLTKIRNALVHAREKRENRVILPTNFNNRKVVRYLPFIRRIAEQIALKS